MQNRVLIIYGPTATGKTDLAIKLAQRYNGEIISADSRQVYVGLDIGSGKVQPDHKVTKRSTFWLVDGVKLHGFDLVKPGYNFSIADFLEFSKSSIHQISQLEKLPIVAGGTGYYIKGLIGTIESIGVPPNFKLRRELEKYPAIELFQKLKSINPKRANSLNQSDKHNPRRLIRAIEIASSAVKTTDDSPPITNYHLICLTAPNQLLYKKADIWLEKRLRSGMIEEVRNLLESNINKTWLKNLGLEYRWLTKYIYKEVTKAEAVESLRGDIHSFIRRQKTWFAKFENKNLYDISKKGWQDQLEKSLSLWYNRQR